MLEAELLQTDLHDLLLELEDRADVPVPQLVFLKDPAAFYWIESMVWTIFWPSPLPGMVSQPGSPNPFGVRHGAPFCRK